MKKGMNLQSIKAENRALVLYLLNEKGLLSRKQIASALGLTAAAVTKITYNLLNKGVIEEREAIGSGVGRKEVLLALKYGNYKAFGITFERDYITFSIASLDGVLCKKENINFTFDFNTIKEKISIFYIKAKEQYEILGAGVSIIGLENDYGIWKDIDIRMELEKIIDVPLVIRNSVQAFSLATILYEGASNIKNVLIFKWGPGIGSSFVREGKVLSGSDSGVAEICHMIVNPNGKLCRCGRKGCLETETALDVIVNDVKKLGYDLNIDEILNSSDENILKILDEKISMVCLALMNASTVLDVSRIVLFGSVFKNTKFLERFYTKWNEISNHLGSKTINVSTLNDKSSYIGSTAMVSRKLFFEKGI